MSAGPGTSYQNTHHRIRKQWGPASQYLCVDCRIKPGEHWSLEGEEPDDITGRVIGRGGFSVMRYSLNIRYRYAPRCAKCHRRHDIAARTAVAA